MRILQMTTAPSRVFRMSLPGDFREFVEQAQKDCKELLNDKKVVFSTNKESKSKDDKDLECNQQDSNSSDNEFSFE